MIWLGILIGVVITLAGYAVGYSHGKRARMKRTTQTVGYLERVD